MQSRWLLALCVAFVATKLTAGVDLYKALNVDKDASERDIKRAYRHRARELHPDKLGREPTDDEQQAFIDLVRAFEILSDPNSRQMYDENGDDAAAAGGGGARQVFNFAAASFDLWVFFPLGNLEFHWTKIEKSKGDDMLIEETIRLRDLLRPDWFNVTTIGQKQVVCPHCHGTAADSPHDLETCPVCSGERRKYQFWRSVNESEVERICSHRHKSPYYATGKDNEAATHDPNVTDCAPKEFLDVMHLHGLRKGFVQISKVPCDHCHRMGTIPTKQCHVCNGTRVTPEPLKLKYQLPPGCPHGLILQFPAQGNEGYRKSAGDVYVRTKVEVPAGWEIKGLDLHVSVHVSLMEAVFGFRKQLLRPDGKIFTVGQSDVGAFSGTHQIFWEEGLLNPFKFWHSFATAEGAAVVEQLMAEGVDKAQAEARANSEFQRKYHYLMQLSNHPMAKESRAKGDMVVSVKVFFPKRLSAADRKKLAMAIGEEHVELIEASIALDRERERLAALHMSEDELRRTRQCPVDMQSCEHVPYGPSLATY